MYEGFGMSFGAGFMGVFWILLIAAIVWALLSSQRNADDSHRITPRDVLGNRYARGEIDEDEYRRRRKELEA